MLLEIVESAGIQKKDLVQRGLSSQVIWRVLHHKDAPTVRAAEKVRRSIQRFVEASIPPPTTTVQNIDHHRWIEVGRVLQRVDPDLFNSLLGTAEATARTKMTPEEKDHQGTLRLRSVRSRDRRK